MLRTVARWSSPGKMPQYCTRSSVRPRQTVDRGHVVERACGIYTPSNVAGVAVEAKVGVYGDPTSP